MTWTQDWLDLYDFFERFALTLLLKVIHHLLVLYNAITYQIFKTIHLRSLTTTFVSVSTITWLASSNNGGCLLWGWKLVRVQSPISDIPGSVNPLCCVTHVSTHPCRQITAVHFWAISWREIIEFDYNFALNLKPPYPKGTLGSWITNYAGHNPGKI